MSPHDQHIQPERYHIIPRTLIFVFHKNEVLLLKYSTSKGNWSGRLNGLGGHVERGEDPLTAAHRELREEAGMDLPDLRLCGTLIIDIPQPSPGIGLYIYAGTASHRNIPPASPEGDLVWISLNNLNDVPLMEDIPVLLNAAQDALKARSVFSALSRTTDDGEIEIVFSPRTS